MNKIGYVFYPPVGIAYVTKDLSDLIKYKLHNKKKIIINTSSQPNSIPHLGTLMTIMTAFALAKKFNNDFNIDVQVQFDELENSPFEKKKINNIIYTKSLCDVYEKGISLSDKNMKTYKEIFDKIKCLSGIKYTIRTYQEFQKKEYIRDIVIQILKNKKFFESLLSPSLENLHIRIKCPVCNLMDKENKNLLIDTNLFVLKNICPVHGEFSIEIKNTNDYIDLNTQLRDLIKGVLLLREDKENNTLTIMVDGGDWGGIWNHRIHCEGLLNLNCNELTTRFFTPMILDWSGAKFSKSLYLKKSYSNINKAFLDFRVFKETFGEQGLIKLWNECESWVSDPKKFFRNYSVEYLDLILNNNIK